MDPFVSCRLALRRLRNAGIALLGSLLLLGAAPSFASVVLYQLTALGANDWRYDYTVRNDGSVASIDEFTIFFDLGLYSNLAVAGSPAGWDSIVADPDPAIPADGFFDSLALGTGLLAGDGPLGGFSVTFTYLGGGTPDGQRFEVVDPDSFQAIERGFTRQGSTVPEPTSWALLLIAGVAAGLCGRRGRRMLGIASLAAAFALAGCGGGSKSAEAQQAASVRMHALAVGGVSAGTVANVSVDALVLVAERRTSRTVYEYDYRLRLLNAGGALDGVIVDLVGAGSGTQIVDGSVLAGTLAAASPTTPADIITIRQDRLQPLQLASLSWRITQAPLLKGTAAVGSALANANVKVTDRAGSAACFESIIVTNGIGNFTCTVRPGKVAPLLVVVSEPFGAYPPMVSIVDTLPPAGTALVANATPLTTAIVGQLAPNGNALAVVADPSLIDLQKLATIKANVMAQLHDVLAALGAPAGYDPFTSPIVAGTPTQAGNTADLIVEMLRFSSVNGVARIGTIDNPSGVPMAGASPGPVLPAPSPGAAALGSTMQMMANAFRDCFALAVNQRVLATNTSIPVNQGGSEVTSMAPVCQNIFHPDYRNAGYRAGQRYYGLLRDSSMVGATFSLPEIMLFIDDTTAADSDVVVLNFRFVDANGIAANNIEVVRKFPGSATVAHPSDWWLHGNQAVVDSLVRPFIRRGEQLAPNPGTPPFTNAGTSRFDTGLELYVNKDGPGSIGLRAARVTGPGLPPAGVVLTRPDPTIITDQTWLNIKSKDGNTDPTVATFATIGNVFLLQRTEGLTGDAATKVRPNPNTFNSNNTAFPNWAHPLDYGLPLGTVNIVDFTQLGAGKGYTFEFFYDGETAPRYVETRTILAPVTPATFAVNLRWIDLTDATRRYLDPLDVLAQPLTTMNLAWIANSLAETVSSAGVYTFNGSTVVNDSVVPVTRGATTATAVAPQNASFQALTSTGNSGRSIQLRYRMLDGSYKDSIVRYNN